MSDSNGRYIGDTDGSARTWRDDEILGGWNAEANTGTHSAQLQKYTVSIPQAELDALRARIRALEAQAARDAAVREAARAWAVARRELDDALLAAVDAALAAREGE